MFFGLLPLLIFAAVFALGAFVLATLVGHTKVKIDGSGPAKTIHVENRFVTLDVRPQDHLNPELAGILVYPGATPQDVKAPESDLEVHLLNKTFRAASATYWTSTPVEIVWEFYRRELPGWHENVHHGTGRELLQSTADGNLKAIRVYSAEGRTMIETAVKPASYIDYKLS